VPIDSTVDEGPVNRHSPFDSADMHSQQPTTWIPEATRRPDVLRAAVVTVGIVSASLLHFFTPPHFILWHNVFQRLYYLPIVYAAVYFGWRGGLLASSVSAMLYIPHIVMAWHDMPGYAANQYAEIILFFLVGTTTGVLADRERRRRQELQATTEQLSKVYRELQDSFEQLKRADRLSAIGELSASLAHEIRNPLGSIEGAAQILEQPQTSEEMRLEFLGVIRKECRRLNRLLTNLLDFARPRPPEFQEIDVRPVVDSVVALLSHTAEQNRIQLRKHVSASLSPVESDSEQLKQVLLNLTINAIQAMPGGGEIEISTAQKNTGIVIAVRDQGAGIPAENVDKIFDPFFTTKDSGTGLGLSVAHQIIVQHGGVITAERNVDRGMTFSVMIPIRHRREA
jgi:two-component system, NtrC family, sensor histidine kinase HydH